MYSILALFFLFLIQAKASFDIFSHLNNHRLSHVCLIIVDMWNTHWCQSIKRRADELAGDINSFANFVRKNGGVIVHAPYMRKLERVYGQHLAYLRGNCLACTKIHYPRNYSIMQQRFSKYYKSCICGCQCLEEPCTRKNGLFLKIHPFIDIDESDYILLEVEKFATLCQKKRIAVILIAGQHLNECILHRPLGVLSLVSLGYRVCLLKDLVAHSFSIDCPSYLYDNLILRIGVCLCSVVLASDIRKILSENNNSD